jgi:uncharacterized membrane protein YjgN (DUF898 family)
MDMRIADPPRRQGLEAELEDGPLRQELGLALRNPTPDPLAPVFEARLRFTGTGSEYYGIWVMNLLLSVLTLGVFSAWAKQRKARWFAQHTELLGDRFDYHGQPLRILAGRAVALVLLALYLYGFLISPLLGWSVLAALILLGPILFASAQRFRLANSSWRGLRFDFRPPVSRVYAVCVPVIVLWLTGTALAALGASQKWLLIGFGVSLLGFPLAHARLKQLQHEHAWFGGERFRFTAAAADFYGLYALAAVLLILASIAAGLIMFVIGRFAGLPSARGLWPVATGILFAIVLWAVVWPYFAARMQQIVWAHTQWGDMRFAGEMRSSTLWKLTFGQMALVLLTAGLYWPFAAVAIARYRIESITMQSDRPLGEVAIQPSALGAQNASGDASADFFGLDLGW